MEYEIDKYLTNSQKAFDELQNFSQKDIDKIVKVIMQKAVEYNKKFAQMAVAETGIGKVEDKITKNILASKYVYDSIKDFKSVGVISSSNNITEIAHPIGPILAIVPATNPTSTLIFKTLIAIKTRNPVIFSLPIKAKNTCSFTAKILYEAALEAGLPKYSIQWVSSPNRVKTKLIMRDERLSLILATGGQKLVKEAYSSGTPALGVGPGNVPVLIDAQNIKLEYAIKAIIKSKTFDNGTICASEQSIIIPKAYIYDLIQILKKHNAYILNDDEIKRVEKVVYNKDKEMMSADIVGKSAYYILLKSGIKIDYEPSVIVAPLKGVGKEYPISAEILAPVLSLYTVDDFDDGIKKAKEVLKFGGMGHTASIFSNNEANIIKYSTSVQVSRVVVNTPSSQGAVGGIYNNLTPSLTLGCGSYGKNITTDNVSVQHLLNIQRVAKPHANISINI